MKRTNAIINGLISIFIFGVVSASAANWTVTKATNSNDGVCNADCSLREAVAVSNSGDLIVFNSNLVGQTFTLGGSAISFNSKRIEIDGNLDGTNVVSLSGSGTSHHFNVGNINTVTGLTLRNMILVQGKGNLAGSLQINDASLALDRVAIRSNTALYAGAIYTLNFSTASITNSSITSNTTTSETGYQTAAIFAQVLYMSNTTVSNNRSLGTPNPNYDAGTIYGIRVYLRNCTITENQGIRGGGFSVSDGDGWILDVGNSIIAGNTSVYDGQDIAFIYGGTAENIISRGGNLIGNTANLPAGIFNQTNDAVNLNPLLAPTNSNQGGHPIFTHPLQAGSPALNTGINSVAVHPLGNVPLTNDGRGTGFPRISNGTVDKGAFEDQSNGSTLIVTKLANSNDFVCDTDCSLREAVYAAGVDSGTDNITFAANVFGTMIVGSEIKIENQNVNIIGYPSISSNTLIVSGNNASRVFNLENANVTMTGFTIANGNGAGASQPFGGGGMLVGGGNLTLNQMVIRNNATAASDLGGGGGLTVVLGSVVRIMNSTFNNNSSYASLGASLDASVIYITNTTFANNSYRSPGEAGFGALTIGNGSLYMRNSTVANNRSPSSTTGAGLYCGGAATCNIGNSLFADNNAANGADLYVQSGGTLNSVGGNIVENTTGYNTGILTQMNDRTGIDAGIMSLADNGGNVTTISLMPSSPAINTGVNAVATDPYSAMPLTSDARGAGFSRIVSTVDVGAFETLVPTAAAAIVAGRVINGKKGVAQAQVQITAQDGTVKTTMTNAFGYFSFEAIEVGQVYIVSAVSKRYLFTPKAITVMEDVNDVNLVAE